MSATVAVAQNPSRGGAILVTVVDTTPGKMPRPFVVMATIPHSPGSRSMLNSVQSKRIGPGRYLLDSLPEDSVHVQVVCPTARPMARSGAKISLHFFVRAAATIDTTVVVDHNGCDPRPIRSEQRVFTGFYTPGFESSRFVPCANDNWMLPADSLSWLPYEPQAWATFNSYHRKDRVQVTGEAKQDSYGNPTYHVRFHGTMTGPESYGHMGVSQFAFAVDSIVSMAGTAPRSCVPVKWENNLLRRQKRDSSAP